MNVGWGILTVVSKINNNNERQRCQHRHSLFGCHVTNRDVAPVFRMNEMKGEEGRVDSSGLVTACVCSWVQAIVHGVGVGCRMLAAVFVFWPVVVVLRSLVVVGICGQSRRAVVVTSVVGGSDEHGWWWWEGEMVVVGNDGGWWKGKNIVFVC